MKSFASQGCATYGCHRKPMHSVPGVRDARIRLCRRCYADLQERLRERERAREQGRETA